MGYALVLLVVVLAVLWLWERSRVGRANRARQRVATRGEAAAEALLEGAGFSVIDRQVTARWTFEVDGEEVDVSCRADLVVERNGPYVAEVKTGDRAPDPTHPATRRQLLEYALAFPDHGILLVDMVEERIYAITFPGTARARDPTARPRVAAPARP